MDKDTLQAYDDEALTALLFGVVSDCRAACADADCPLQELPNGSLTEVYDAISALPRFDKLALLSLNDCCDRRRSIDERVRSDARRTASRTRDTTHLLRQRR